MNSVPIDDLKPCSVIKIPEFNLQNKEGNDKPVWMLYLGRDSFFDCPLFLHLHRYTTQIQHYEPGGSREHHKVIRFFNPPYTFFEAEQSILDFNERPYPLEKEQFVNNFWSKCTVAGEFEESKIREICKYIKSSPHYSKKQKQSIRTSLNEIGITGISF